MAKMVEEVKVHLRSSLNKDLPICLRVNLYKKLVLVDNLRKVTCRDCMRKYKRSFV